MHNYPLADMVVRIKNAYRAYHTSVSLPYSSLKKDVVKILLEQGYIKDYKIQEVSAVGGKELIIFLRYINKKPAVNEFKVISKPGVRRYVNKKKGARALSGLGTVIISTSRGIMTVRQARKKGLGGELLCYIW